MNYKPVIGLEVHIELKTRSKMFCRCLADYFGHKPNTHVCPVCLGLPGALPVPNKKAIDWCIMIGLALNCKIPQFSKFDRKNYFYPDLPKGYQISQYDQPFARDGELKLKIKNEKLKIDEEKIIRIRRVHMEEDTAKLIHQFGNQTSNIKNQNKGGYSLIDFNRSGVPLVEIVTEPDFETALEVKEYLQKIQQIVRYLDVSNADMEKGDMRLEPNISVREIRNDALPKYKVEIKNINSFRFVEKAINYEIERQEKSLESGKIPEQETRGWDEKKQITVSQRTKEEVHDYRYFPEPDIPPIRWRESQISNLKLQIPELPSEKLARFEAEYNLSSYDTKILTKEKDTADYFEEAVKVNKELGIRNQESTNIKTIANMIINKKININTILPSQLIQAILSSTQIVLMDEKELKNIIKQVLLDNPKAVSDYKGGETNTLQFLIGQVIKKIAKKINLNSLKTILEEILKEKI